MNHLVSALPLVSKRLLPYLESLMHQPRKRFGQNFLQDESIIRQIIGALHLQPTDHCLEIGPGLGALTRPLLANLNQLHAVEIDRDLQHYLIHELPNAKKLTLIAADALTIDYTALGPALRIIGNLPYNISTPLLIRLLEHIVAIKDIHVMLQKEVAERLAAAPGSKTYGRLSVMMQYYCHVDYLFTVPGTAFHPIPKVESAVVRMTPHQQNRPDIPFHHFETIVAEAFAMRRKTLHNNLKHRFTPADFTALDIDPRQRAEQLPVSAYVTMAAYSKK